ncbi:MAG: glycosyltransferase family 2 protein [Gemmataceae bacterium]
MLSATVLIPSYRRAVSLVECLQSLALQTVLPAAVIVVWQGDDTATPAAIATVQATLPYPVQVLHSATVSIPVAENIARRAATSPILALIDDDARPAPNWLARHLAFYDDPTVGAVGGPADNYNPDGSLRQRRGNEPIGRLTWYGKMIGNMHTQLQEWRTRPPQQVDHLVGYNMTFRAEALPAFEERLKRYWQLFELDACWQIRKRGYRILFDFSNVVDHHPTNETYAEGRDGDLELKIFAGLYNTAFVLSKHTAPGLRLIRLLYLLLVGNVSTPGLVGSLVAWRRYGHFRRECRILRRAWKETLSGWQAGRNQRHSTNSLSTPH